MAFDAHKNFAYSQVATAPSPASSGTSVTVVAGDGAKFPAASFNAMVWPVNTQPTTTNAEIVRVTVVSTDTFTITRAQESSNARSIVVGDQIAAGVTAKSIADIEGGTLGLFDYVVSGCVWTADAAGSTKAASMTAGTIWLNNVKLSVAAVTARTFTASKDVYVDFSDNGDGTAAITYTDNTTNAASPALTAGNLRNAIVVVGASSIAAASSINQGEPNKVLPIASSIPYTTTDSLGNLICPRDPNRRVLGYRQVVANQGSLGAGPTDLTGLSMPIIAPANRKVKVSCGTHYQTNTDNGTAGTVIVDVTNTANVRTGATGKLPGTWTANVDLSTMLIPSVASITYKLQQINNAVTNTLVASAINPAFIMAELV